MISAVIKKRFEEGVTAHRNGELARAAKAYEEVLGSVPDYLPALQHMGLLMQQLGKPECGVLHLQKALELDPADVGSWNNLANMLRELGRNREAIDAYRCALRENPVHLNALYNLGVTLQNVGDWRESADVYRKLLSLSPDDHEAWNALGTVSGELKELDESENAFRRVLELEPRHADACNNLGSLLRSRGQLAEARQMFQLALASNPNLAEAHNNLGNLFLSINEITAAIERYRLATHLNPEHAISWSNLANALQISGDVSGAIPYFRRALQLDPTFHGAHSNLLFCLNYLSEMSPEDLAKEHFNWGLAHGGRNSGSERRYENSPNHDRILKVGYVSPDFRAHSVAYFIESFIRNHDRNAVECFCYSDVEDEDEVTNRLRSFSDEWRDTTRMNDAEFASVVEDDRIDILVDLAGHTKKNRLSAFALKPAPVQVSYIGYPNTTGLNAIDYRITDALADPPGMSENWHCEQLIRLPGGFLCYAAPDGAPEIRANPLHQNGYVTFGSFNNLSKMTDEVVHTWCRILRALPGSRLFLKTQQLQDEVIRKNTADRFNSLGVDSSRLTMLPPVTSLSEHLSTYSNVDIALDTFPYNGTTTTCEALWMGVPVVGIAGERHAGRVGLSLLHRLGLTDLIAEDIEDYVSRSLHLARDPERVVRLRMALRERMRSSDLMNAGRACAELENAYRKMWTRWCDRAAFE